MQIVELKQILNENKRAMLEDCKSTLQNMLAGTSNLDATVDDDDLANVCQQELMQMLSLNRQNLMMRQIDKALQKISDGLYGKCEECGCDIAPERLKIMPFAVYCKDCQEALEEQRLS